MPKKPAGKMAKVMGEFKRGTLHGGINPAGPKKAPVVKSRAQPPQQPEGYREDRGAPYNNGYGAAAPGFWHSFAGADWNTAAGNVGQFLDGQKQQAARQGEDGAGEMFQHKPQQRPYKWLKFKGLLDG